MSKRILLLAIVLLLLVSILPASAQTTTLKEYIGAEGMTLDAPSQTTNWNDVWDLTQGDLVLSYTLDLSTATQPPPPGDPNAGEYGWFYVNRTPWVEVGLRGEGAPNFNPGPRNVYQGNCGGWMVSDPDAYLGTWENGVLIDDRQNILDLDDDHGLQASGGRSHRDYDVLLSDPDTVLPPFGSDTNYGFWFDRDGVDPYQDNDPTTPLPGGSGVPWGQRDGRKTYDTGGVYDIVITYHAIDADGDGDKTDDGLGVMFATINGVPQGHFVGGWQDAQPEMHPAGLSFKGDMEHMQVFAGLWAESGSGWDYGHVVIRNMTVNGVLGTSDPLIPSFTATQLAGNEVQFDASATHGGMDPYTYNWDFDADGVVDLSTSEPIVTYTFPAPGDYSVLLMVTPFRCTPVASMQTITIVPPKANLAIAKSGPIWANMGAELTYTYDVTNAGPAGAAPIVSDDKCGVPTYTSGDANANGLVDPGETWQFTCAYTPNPADVKAYMTLTNTATVMPEGVEDSDPSDNSDTYSLVWTVLRKDVLLYWQGHNVGYDDRNTEFTFEMWKDGALLGTFTIKESAPVYFWLSEGPYIFYEVNIPAGYTPARAQWSWTVKAGDPHMDMSFENLIRFDLAVEKTGPTECVAPDSMITYQYKVTNAGPAAVTPVLWDDKAGAPVYVSGDTNGDGKIQAGEEWFYTAGYIVPEVAVGTNVVNTVTVKDAEDDYGDGWKLGGDTDLTNNTDSYSVCVSWYGFTPGYWKNHPKQWPEFSITNHDGMTIAVTKSTPVLSVFDVPDSLLKLKNGTYILDLNKDGKNDQLIHALAYKGGDNLAGKAQILLRAATAALLNEAALGGYFLPYDSVADLIAAVNATLATGDPAQYTALAAYLDYWNNGLHKFP